MNADMNTPQTAFGQLVETVAGQAFARAHVVNESFRITAETPVTPTQTTASITVPGDFSAYLYWTVVAILDVTNEVGLATIPCALRIA